MTSISGPMSKAFTKSGKFIKYIGMDPIYYGRKLTELLPRLKDFGVGRIVYRWSEHKTFPETSYFLITEASPRIGALDHQDCGWVKARRVYRGIDYGEVRMIILISYPDWWLVPKYQEKEFLSSRAHIAPMKKHVMPSKVVTPPIMSIVLQNELARQEHLKAGKSGIEFINPINITKISDAENAFSSKNRIHYPLYYSDAELKYKFELVDDNSDKILDKTKYEIASANDC